MEKNNVKNITHLNFKEQQHNMQESLQMASIVSPSKKEIKDFICHHSMLELIFFTQNQ